jgi:aspartyl protease family protein
VTDVPALIFYALLLILPVSALVARRVPTATLMKMALIWVAIFGLGVAILHAVR